MSITFAALALAAAQAAAAPVAADPPPPGISPILYVRRETGFERQIPIHFDAMPRVGEEMRAGPSNYRVIRILHVTRQGRVTETRLFVERIGPADPD